MEGNRYNRRKVKKKKLFLKMKTQINKDRT